MKKVYSIALIVLTVFVPSTKISNSKTLKMTTISCDISFDVKNIFQVINNTNNLLSISFFKNDISKPISINQNLKPHSSFEQELIGLDTKMDSYVNLTVTPIQKISIKNMLCFEGRSLTIPLRKQKSKYTIKINPDEAGLFSIGRWSIEESENKTTNMQIFNFWNITNKYVEISLFRQQKYKNTYYYKEVKRSNSDFSYTSTSPTYMLIITKDAIGYSSTLIDCFEYKEFNIFYNDDYADTTDTTIIGMSSNNPGYIALEGTEEIASISLCDDETNDDIENQVSYSTVFSPIKDYKFNYILSRVGQNYFNTALESSQKLYISNNFNYEINTSFEPIYFKQPMFLGDYFLQIPSETDFYVKIDEKLKNNVSLFSMKDGKWIKVDEINAGLEKENIQFYIGKDIPSTLHTLKIEKGVAYIYTDVNYYLKKRSLKYKSIAYLYKLNSFSYLFGLNKFNMNVPVSLVNNVAFVPAKYFIEPIGGVIKLTNNNNVFMIAPKQNTRKYIDNEDILEFANGSSRSINLEKIEIICSLGNPTATLNGKQVQIDPKNPKITPIIINGRTMVPLRFLAESLGCKVEWKKDTKEIIVTYQP